MVFVVDDGSGPRYAPFFAAARARGAQVVSYPPDALEKALLALRPLAVARGGRLWAVFDYGGNRDAVICAAMQRGNAGAVMNLSFRQLGCGRKVSAEESLFFAVNFQHADNNVYGSS